MMRNGTYELHRMERLEIIELTSLYALSVEFVALSVKNYADPAMKTINGEKDCTIR